jgi:hypothetical protein
MSFTFTHEEYVDMHFVYGFYNGNGRAATGKSGNSMLFSEAHIQVHEGFSRRVVLHGQRYGGRCTMTVFAPTISEKCNNFLPVA